MYYHWVDRAKKPVKYERKTCHGTITKLSSDYRELSQVTGYEGGVIEKKVF